jgi:hypothetical protein
MAYDVLPQLNVVQGRWVPSLSKNQLDFDQQYLGETTYKIVNILTYPYFSEWWR